VGLVRVKLVNEDLSEVLIYLNLQHVLMAVADGGQTVLTLADGRTTRVQEQLDDFARRANAQIARIMD
jgi:hypothetical protein